MDDCHDALDCVNRAAKLAFENDTELESKCEAFTGKIFFKGLVKLAKAKLHLTNCVRLAATLAPKDVSQEAWHMLAVKLATVLITAVLHPAAITKCQHHAPCCRHDSQ